MGIEFSKGRLLKLPFNSFCVELILRDLSSTPRELPVAVLSHYMCESNFNNNHQRIS